jgi:hypothetical protein
MTSRQEEIYEVLHAIGWELVEQVGGTVRLNFYDGKKLFRKCEVTPEGMVTISDGSKLNFFDNR